jgi:hypothetical protein
MDNVPLSAWLELPNVCVPVLAVKVPLFVMPPPNVGVIAAFSVQLPPALIVNKPLICGVLTSEKVIEPEDPPPMVTGLDSKV